MRRRQVAIFSFLSVFMVGASPGSVDIQAEHVKAEQAQATALRELVNITKADISDRQMDKGCSNGEDVRSSDLCAQWKAADSARDAALWAQKSYDLSCWATLGVLGTLLLALWSNRIALMALDVENRPWLDVEKIEFEPFMRIDNDPTHVICFGKVHLRNTGKTVATQLVVRWWMEEDWNAFHSRKYWKRGSMAVSVQDVPPSVGREAKITISMPLPAENTHFTVRSLALDVRYSAPGQWRKRRIRQAWSMVEMVFQNTAQPMAVDIVDRQVAPIAHHEFTFQIS